jgi:hypothetical protein
MPVYRYSPQAIARLVERMRRRTYLINGLMLLVIFKVILLTQGILEASIGTSFFVVILGLSTLAQRKRRAQKLTATAESIEIELDEVALTSRSSITALRLPREEVKELRHHPDALVVKGPSIQRSIHVSKELDGYQTLAAEIEAWTPPAVPRTEKPRSSKTWIWALSIAALAVTVVGFITNNPAIAFPSCVLGAAFYLGYAVWIFRMKNVSAQLKRLIVIFLIPAAALIARACFLWTLLPPTNNPTRAAIHRPPTKPHHRGKRPQFLSRDREGAV